VASGPCPARPSHHCPLDAACRDACLATPRAFAPALAVSPDGQPPAQALIESECHILATAATEWPPPMVVPATGACAQCV